MDVGVVFYQTGSFQEGIGEDCTSPVTVSSISSLNGTLRLESHAILVRSSCGLPALPAGILNV